MTISYIEVRNDGIRVSAWDGWIAPGSLVELVHHAAPYLFEGPPCGEFVAILGNWQTMLDEGLSFEEQLQRYFALCMACHHSTVASFVPTDVDSKIRGLIWRKTRDRDTLRAMCDFAIAVTRWPLAPVSTRNVDAGELGLVSGVHGEWLSVLLGAHGRFLATGDTEYAEKTAAAVDAELAREAEAFRKALFTPGRELDTTRLAMILTHNVGDVDQGISFWESRHQESRQRFARLAHENTAPYGGWFQLAAAMYKDGLSAEGHRNYPLRAVKALRRSPDLLLPVPPCLDEWGGVIGTHPSLAIEERAEVLDALVRGCRKVQGQSGYYRAIAGFTTASARNFDAAQQHLPNATRKDLRDPELRRLVAIPRVSFESSLRKKVSLFREKFTSRR